MEASVTTSDGVYFDWDETYEIYEDKYVQYLKTRPALLGVIILTLLIIGLIGNGLVILSAVLNPSKFNSANSAFFINLCVASIVFLGFGIPLILYENVFMHTWTLGEAFCKFHRYVQYCCFYGLAYAEVLIVLFQFLSLAIPNKIIKINNVTFGAIICILKWVIILLANIPNWTGHGLYNEMEGLLFCYNKEVSGDIKKLKINTLLHFLFSFALPFVLMCFVSLLLFIYRVSPLLYSELGQGMLLQKRTVTLTILLTVLFAVCWTPDKIFAVLLTFKPSTIDLNFLIISDVFLCLACLNPCLNPWCIYIIMVRATMPGRESATRYRIGQQGGVVVGPFVEQTSEISRDNSMVQFAKDGEVVTISGEQTGQGENNKPTEHARESDNAF